MAQTASWYVATWNVDSQPVHIPQAIGEPDARTAALPGFLGSSRRCASPLISFVQHSNSAQLSDIKAVRQLPCWQFSRLKLEQIHNNLLDQRAAPVPNDVNGTCHLGQLYDMVGAELMCKREDAAPLAMHTYVRTRSTIV